MDADPPLSDSTVTLSRARPKHPALICDPNKPVLSLSVSLARRSLLRLPSVTVPAAIARSRASSSSSRTHRGTLDWATRCPPTPRQSRLLLKPLRLPGLPLQHRSSRLPSTPSTSSASSGVAPEQGPRVALRPRHATIKWERSSTRAQSASGRPTRMLLLSR